MAWLRAAAEGQVPEWLDVPVTGVAGPVMVNHLAPASLALAAASAQDA